jgi:phosphoglucosamine mutase
MPTDISVPRMFGTSGIRGPVGESVTAELALNVGRAVASTGVRRAVVGRDTRESGYVLADAVSAGLRECGADVVRVGVASTPTVARGVGWHNADAGVAVTASHNPPEDNGLKLWTADGQAFGSDARREVSRRLTSERYRLADWNGHGRERESDVAPRRHRHRLRQAVAVPDDFRVVVDVGNGAGRLTADVLADEGCWVRTLDGQPDGRFPARQSEPTAMACRGLAQAVEAFDADLGIAHDGDADRMVAVDDTGSFVSGDTLLALFAREAVAPGTAVAVPVNASRLVDDAVGDAGGDVERTRVGDVHVAERARESNVVFGGEPSGAWIWPDETLCPDGHYAACRLVDLVVEAGPLSSLVGLLEPYPIRRESLEVDDPIDAVETVHERVARRYDEFETIDGVRVEFSDGWFLVRASGTQPLVRVTAESPDPGRAEELLSDAAALVG